MLPIHLSTAISPSALPLLVNDGWPGNVRELQDTIERAVILCSDDTIDPIAIQLSALGKNELANMPPNSTTAYRPVSLDSIEQEQILATLEWTKWNKFQAAPS